MEGNENDNEGSFLKIDTIWSEADGNPDSLTFKEELSSDLEPESTLPNENKSPNDNSFVLELMDNQKNKNLPYDEPIPMEQTDIPVGKLLPPNSKLECLHDRKNFKIFKRRLRCGNCKTAVCPECCKIITTTLLSHFSGCEMNKSTIYGCKLCQLVFYSNCALQAHIRIHFLSMPYVCPECGLIFNNIYFLILHLINKCFHVYKTVKLKCKGCPGVYFSTGKLLLHIKENHLIFLYRCSICNAPFHEADEFKTHKAKVHKSDKARSLKYFSCSLCSNMVLPKFVADKHINQHRNGPESYEIQYECVCKRVYYAASAFQAHLKNCKKNGILPPQWNFLKRNLKVDEQVDTSNVIPEVTISAPKSKEISFSKFYKKAQEQMEKEKSQKQSGNLGKNSDLKDPKSKNQIGEIFSSTIISDFKSVSLSRIADSTLGQQSSNCNQVIATTGIKTAEKPETGEGFAANIDTENHINGNEADDNDFSKLQYDHIPCDHLGYLTKSSGGEVTKDSPTVEVSATVTPGPHTVTKLDDRTGVICKEDTLLPKTGDKFKSKISNSFNCPFCPFSFVKQIQAFQQFKFHIDLCHPNAGLDVSFKQNESSESEKVTSVSENNDVRIIENTEDSRNDVSENNVVENQEHRNSSDGRISEQNKAPKIDSNKKIFKETPLEIVEKDSDITVETPGNTAVNENLVCEGSPTLPPKNPCWTISVSVESNKNIEEEKSKEENKNLSNNQMNTQKKTEFEEYQLSDCYVVIENNSLIKESQLKTLTVKQHKAIENETESSTTENKADNSSKDLDSREKLSSEKASEETPSDLKDNFETSKDVTCVPDISIEHSKETAVESKHEEKERYKSESEVWTKLYESLNIAENLKKRKEKKLQLDEENKSLLLNYSSKRIVRKPKRYGDSSDSDDSAAGCGSSESVIDNAKGVETEVDKEAQVEDHLFLKKQKLIRKLRNADNKFLDDLFDLVNQKQRRETHKKHSSSAIESTELKNDTTRSVEIDESADPDILNIFPESEEITKPIERKRGRPRKIENVTKGKERRRSDKEVDFIEKNFREENEFSPSKRKRKLSTKLQFYKKIDLAESQEKEEFTSGQVIAKKSIDLTKKFTCVMCKEIFTETSAFRQHITLHRMEDSSYQCMECGECFVVKLSLEKHLNAFHKIKNIEKYIMENDCRNTKRALVESESEPLKENQCKVCKDQFDRPIDLTKHFRIHGMAFLKEFKKDGKMETK